MGRLVTRRINDSARPFALIDPDGPFGDEIVAGSMTEDVANRFAATHEEVERLGEALKSLLAVAEMTTFSDQFPRECEDARAALQQGGGDAT